MRKVDITGHRFGRLLVLNFQYSKGTKRYWECICDCGNTKIVTSSNLVTGHTKSCGCLAREEAEKKNYTHGCASRLKGESREYRIWLGMKNRCSNSKNPRFDRYGGRGIEVCDSWFNSFETFLQDMGPCPNGYSIERLNNDLGYCKENCVWGSSLTQANNKCNNALLTYRNLTMTLSQWARKLGCSHGALYSWINRGKSLKEYIKYLSGKLDIETVQAIKSDYVPRTFGATKLSAKYGIPIGTVKDIIRGVTWKKA